MNTPLREAIRHHFSYLFEKWGFEFITVNDDFEGNIVIVQSDKLRIRFIQDRADFFMDIGNTKEPEKWISFYKVLDQLQVNSGVTIEYKYSNKMKVINNLLREHFSAIQNWFLYFKKYDH